MNVDNILSKLSLKEQLLQLMMIDIRYFEAKKVYQLPLDLMDFMAKYEFGGIILFAENVEQKNKIKYLVEQIQKNSKITKLIGLDEEGGIVSRINGISTPGNMALGAINDVNVTQNIAQIIGYELADYGINLNFAPVVDINSNPLNPIIGVRSFAGDKNIVTKHAQAFIAGLRQSNVISCVKHFPGHGDTVTDTHYTLSIVDKNECTMMDNELFPYYELIKSNMIDMLMTAHIVAPQIDNNKLFATKINQLIDTPATFSYSILTRLLRDKLAYTGVIISDALDMGAIVNNFTQLEASIYALIAGVDILLMPFRVWNKNDLRAFNQYFESLYTYVMQSDFLKQRVTESCLRVLQLKQNYFNKCNQNNNKINDAANYVDLIAKRGITLLNNNTLPWVINSEHKVLSLANNNLILDEVQNITSSIGYTSDVLNYMCELDDIMMKINHYTHILLYSYNLTKPDPILQQIIDKLNQLNKPYVLIVTCNPYDVLYLN